VAVPYRREDPTLFDDAFGGDRAGDKPPE
jgi:hypothetical protein